MALNGIWVKFFAIVGLGFVIYKIVQFYRVKVHTHSMMQKLGCKPPKRFITKDPLLGLDLFMSILKDIKNHTILESTRARYRRAGSNTIVFGLFGGDAISTTEPENVKALLSKEFEDYAVSPLRYMLVPFIGNGIFTRDSAAWQHSRHLLRPMFTKDQISDLSLFETHVVNLLSRVPMDNTMVDLQPLFLNMTLDIATHVFFGESLNCQTADGEVTEGTKFNEAYNGILEAFANGSQIDIWGIKIPNRKFNRDCIFVKEFVDNQIRKALAEKHKGVLEEKQNTQVRSVFLHELCSQTEDVVEIRNEILSTILAGRDTTSSAMSDLWFEVAKHPQVFDTLKKEIDGISGQVLTAELLKSMKYLKAVINEILRLHPVVPDNGRISITDTMLPLGGGEDGLSPVFVPAGTLVQWSTYAMHRDHPEVFGERGNEFIPERWLDTEHSKGIRPGWAYLPFGGGPRICLGQQFALLQMMYVTVRIMQTVDSVTSCDPEPWREKLAITATSLNGAKVAFKPRQ